ncbi:MAG: hypothetical protein C0432_03185 [Candidatus Puniceispirillum sp.]|nr:hypothetical protein [Candidatus Pelagibacter sp.]MBA4283278.1 hypothetical protein [Candidatus Puniceispirillum sp.]
MKLFTDPHDNPKKKTLKTAEPKQKKIKEKAKKNRLLNFLFNKIFYKLFLSFMFMGVVSVGGIILWHSKDLPNLNNLAVNSRKPSITIQTQNGIILGTYGDVYEDMLWVKDLPEHVIKALITVEDRRFFSHFGIDIIGLVRAAIANYRAGKIVQGGSTLTQQLAKNILQSHGKFHMDDRSMKRKIQEVVISIWLEWHFTKDQILTMYLNRVCFGGTIYGVDAAARIFFKKSARNLNIFEAAVIAGLLKAPTRYSPAHRPKEALKRASDVLKLMEEAGIIKDYKSYVAQGEEQLKNLKKEQAKSGRYFADWVYEQIPDLIGPISQDLVVITTLDPDLQSHAEKVAQHFNETLGKKLKASQISFVAMAPEGAVKAMVGGRNYNENQFNRVTQALRQPGSTFKTFVYLAAMEAGMTPDTMMDDSPITIGDWTPSLYKYIPQGEITLKEAFRRSVNPVSVRIAEQLTSEVIADTAERLGILNCQRHGLSMALGTSETTLLDLTSAHATFVNDGYRSVPYGIAEIRDKEGNIIYQHQHIQSTLVVQPKDVEYMRELLRNVVSQGSGRAANIDDTVAGKTGSNGDKDAWFIFYRENKPGSTGFLNFVGGIWVGNDNYSNMHKRSTGGNMPTRVANAIMQGPSFFGDNSLKKTTTPETPHDENNEVIKELDSLFEKFD